MARNLLKFGAEFLLISLIVLNLTWNTNAKQAIRLQNGLECPMPGYFRDVQNCRKFYFCPYGSFKRPSHLTDEEKQIMKEIAFQGVECPEESFFDESTSTCQSFIMADIVPLECRYPDLIQPQTAEQKTGAVPYISNNDH